MHRANKQIRRDSLCTLCVPITCLMRTQLGLRESLSPTQNKRVDRAKAQAELNSRPAFTESMPFRICCSIHSCFLSLQFHLVSCPITGRLLLPSIPIPCPTTPPEVAPAASPLPASPPPPAPLAASSSSISCRLIASRSFISSSRRTASRSRSASAARSPARFSSARAACRFVAGRPGAVEMPLSVSREYVDAPSAPLLLPEADVSAEEPEAEGEGTAVCVAAAP